VKRTINDILFLVWFLSYPAMLIGSVVLVAGFVIQSRDAILFGSMAFMVGVGVNISGVWEIRDNKTDLTDEIDRNQ
jgi:hypothetical protein